MFRRIFYLTFLAALLCGTAAASTEQWVQLQSPHFTVLTNASEKQGRHVLDQMERMRWVFHVLFPKAQVDPSQPIRVLAMKNEKSFTALEPASYLGKGQLKLDGYFLRTPDRNYILLRLDAGGEHPFATIYHEYTHLQFAAASEWMPLWLNEGLAEFIQNTDIHDSDVEFGKSSVDDILYLRQNQIIPLPVLFKVDVTSPYYHEEQKGSVFYSESWALTHYLLVTDHEKHTHTFDNYMARLKQREDPVRAAEESFGDLKQLEMALQSYIRNSDYKQFVLNNFTAPVSESSYKVKLLSPLEAQAAMADVLAYLQRTGDARQLLDAVLKQDPGNLQAQETMGFLEFRAGNLSAARNWYEQAVKLNSQDYLAHYYFAALSMQGGGSETDEKIEASLRTAIRLNPGFAPSYDLLAALFTLHRRNLDEAHRLSIQAIQLDPGNVGFRLNAANTLLVAGQYASAHAVLQTAEKVAHNPDELAAVRSRIEQVEQILQTASAQEEAHSQQSPAGSTVVTVGLIDSAPKHPTEAADAPKLTAEGIIRGVSCAYPSVIEFHLKETAGKEILLYNNDYYRLDVTAVGFTPKSSMSPCQDFEGMKAQIQYVISSDKSVDGQVVAIELRK